VPLHRKKEPIFGVPNGGARCLVAAEARKTFAEEEGRIGRGSPRGGRPLGVRVVSGQNYVMVTPHERGGKMGKMEFHVFGYRDAQRTTKEVTVPWFEVAGGRKR